MGASSRSTTPTFFVPDRLERFRWKGEATYRVLSYYFSFRWTSERGGAYVQRVFAPFAVRPDPAEERVPPTPGLPFRYSLVRYRGGGLPYLLLFGSEVLLQSDLPSVLRHLVWHVNAEAIRHTGDFLLVHAGAVVTPHGDGVLLPASSGSGKTTLVGGLVRAGFGYLSDEAGAIDPVSRKMYPYPKALSVKERRAELFPEVTTLNAHLNGRRSSLNTEWHLLAEDIRPGALAGPSDIQFVVAPEYRPGARTELTPISRAAAATELLKNALNLPRYGSRALPLIASIARGARGYRLQFDNLEEALEAVIAATTAG